MGSVAIQICIERINRVSSPQRPAASNTTAKLAMCGQDSSVNDVRGESGTGLVVKDIGVPGSNTGGIGANVRNGTEIPDGTGGSGNCGGADNSIRFNVLDLYRCISEKFL